MDEECEIGSVPWENEEFPDREFKTLFQHVSSNSFIVCEMDICFYPEVLNGQCFIDSWQSRYVYRRIAIREDAKVWVNDFDYDFL
jgi:hypothetical protein